MFKVVFLDGLQNEVKEQTISKQQDEMNRFQEFEKLGDVVAKLKFMDYIHNTEVKLSSKKAIEDKLTSNLFEVFDFGKILSFDKDVYISMIRAEDDGEFQSENEWFRFCELVELRGAKFLSEYIADNRTIWDERGNIRVVFPNTVNLVTGYKLMKGIKLPILSVVKEITIALDYEWYFKASGALVSILEVKGKIIDYK